MSKVSLLKYITNHQRGNVRQATILWSRKSDTRAASFELFKEGMSVAEIAKERGFAVQTIEGHLAYYVSQGDINIKELVGTEKLLLIEAGFKRLYR